jgi:hypothetical protein
MYKYNKSNREAAQSSDATIFPRPPRVTERHPPPQWVLSLRYSLSLCGSLPSSGARSSTAMYFLAPLSIVSSSPAAASLRPCPPPSRRRRHLGHLPLSNERNPPPQWIFPLRYSSRRVGEWTPHRSDCSTARPTAPTPAHPIQQRLSSTGSVLSPSSLAAAASWASLTMNS